MLFKDLPMASSSEKVLTVASKTFHYVVTSSPAVGPLPALLALFLKHLG
jgi:hypothetical protein